MMITLVGSNHYLMKKRLDELTTKFITRNGYLALERVDATEADARAILDAVSSGPFLAPGKMVVIRGVGQNKAASEIIEQIISSVVDNVNVILYEPITDKRTVFYKTLKSKTQLEEFNGLDPLGLAKWLVNEAKQQGASLDLPTASYLVDRVGADQAQLANELNKLITFAPLVSKESIELLSEKTPQSKVFDLLDAAFSGRKNKALDLYAEQRAQRVEPQAILAMLAWQLHLLALAKTAGTRPSSEVAKDAGVNPYPVTKAANLVRQLSAEKLQELTARALEIDRMAKTRSIDLDEALKTYIVAI